MKMQPLLSTAMKFSIVFLLAVQYGCGQENTDSEENSAQAEPVEISCEVKMPASSLKNSLLAPSENLKFTMRKLHELAESHDHNHDRISTQVKIMVDEGVKLMDASAYLTSGYLDSLLYYSTRSTVLANTIYATNESFGKAKLKAELEELESLASRISNYTERKVKVSEDVCMTNKELLENQIRLYFTTLRYGVKAIESSLDSHCEDCKPKEIAFYEILLKSFREALIKAPTSQYKTVSRTLADVEHTLLELSNAHEAEEAHHTMETLDRQMDRLRDELLDITGRSNI